MFLIVSLLIFFELFSRIHSIGTLLHAGPSCIIKPQSQYSSQNLIEYSSLKHRGICYSNLLCKQKGGVAIGKCGLGNSCCVFPQTCNSISVRNSTYFTSPGYAKFLSKSLRLENNHKHNRKVNNNNNNNNNNKNKSQKRSNLIATKINEDDGVDGGEENVIIQNEDNESLAIDLEEFKHSNLCPLTIHRMPGIQTICRIRLDFIEYEIKGKRLNYSDPNVCINQKHTNFDNNTPMMNNSNTNLMDWITLETLHGDHHSNIIEPICLPSKLGQHVIIDVHKHFGPFLLTVHKGSVDGIRRWNILINQVACSQQSNPKVIRKNQFKEQISNMIDSK
ncbi:hypothetical protein SSS_02204 [Sarcoptes scabiei]|uniref:Uncharacterized protein n=1 Tax=Sarcoptes scabiei TaxID=52283 RepID=A0A834RCV4_SARSC|nr:hypothetical protein SSS_02204 [Sarcoptes scabiei]